MRLFRCPAPIDVNIKENILMVNIVRVQILHRTFLCRSCNKKKKMIHISTNFIGIVKVTEQSELQKVTSNWFSAQSVVCTELCYLEHLI